MDDGRQRFTDDAVNRYVDGAMSAPEAAAFERQMAQDASLRAEVRSLREVDESLRGYFGDWRAVDPPVRVNLNPKQDAAPNSSQHRRPFRRRQFLMAASMLLLLSLAGAFVLLQQSGPGAEVLYQREIASGFKPLWVCDTDLEFARWTNNILRQPLVPASDAPEGVRTLGWSRAGDESPLSAGAAVMLAEVDGAEIVVVVDRLENDAKVRVSTESGLHVFRKELGPLVLYELTPRDHPAALEAVELAPPDIFDRDV